VKTDKLASGMKNRDERSREWEILIAEALAKIEPTDPLRLAKPTARRNFFTDRDETDPLPQVVVWSGRSVHKRHDERARETGDWWGASSEYRVCVYLPSGV
jgi:hypothetical protein